MSMLSLFVRYGEGSHGAPQAAVSTVEQLHRLYRDRFPIGVRSIVIDNALPADAAPVDHGTHWVIPGDNSCSEFSGWDRGLAFAGELGLVSSVVHLVTSTFTSMFSSYTKFVDERLLPLMARRDACLGHVDAYNEPVTLFGVSSQHWIRTSYLFLSRDVLHALGSLVSIPDAHALFPDDDSALFREDAPISDNYRDYIVRWISGQDIGQAMHWHSGFPITPKELPRFRRKAHAILNEHLLSIRLRRAGVRLLDAIWLGHHLRNVRVPLFLQGWSPDWRRQLAERPVGALALGDDGFAPAAH